MRVPATLLALSLLATACAHSRHHDGDHHDMTVEKTVVVETKAATEPAVELVMPRPYPERASKRIQAFGKRRVDRSELVKIEPPAGGFAYHDLFVFLSKEAGIRIRYDDRSSTIKNGKLTFAGEAAVPRSDLIAWAQDALFYGGVVLVPQGPADRHEYIAMDVASPYVASRPTFVREDDLPALEGRVGLYVSCVLTVPDGLDASRARNALSQIATKTAGLGRVSDIGKDSTVLVVTDFASVVATMRRALDEMEAKLYENSLR
jgi:hypothetical protein